LLALLVRNLHRSASGRTITAVRNSEAAASTSGLSIPRTKLSIFALSAAVAGLGGVLVATQNGGITSVNFPTGTSLAWLATVVLFGIRKPQGAILAGLSFAASDPIFNNGFHFAFLPKFMEWDGLGSTTATSVSQILFGLGAIQLARQPDGVLAITAMQNRARRDKRKAKAAKVAPAASITVREDATTPRVTSPVYVPDAEVAFSLRDIRSGYGLVEVLRGVTLSVAKGHITAVLGPNGAGKSTTCLTAAGRVAATAGTIEFNGQDITKLSAHKRAQMGIVLAPEARGIFPGLTVRENLQMWLPSAADRDQVYERFPILGERRNLPSGNLSGGEQQILTLSSLLVNPPQVLIADEPSLGLAPLIVEQIMALFVELKNRGTALLLVEEKARDLLDIADSVAVINLGRISWYGPRSEVDAERIATEYLGALA
jgi:ABC-type branched-subunit amino acid transport system ATPase component